MMIMPAIDLKEGKCVRLLQGDPDQKTVYSEDPVQMARHWEGKGAECLHVVDLDGAFSGFPVHLDLIEKIARAIQIPIQVGGGMRSLETIGAFLERGAQRVILGTKAVGSPDFLEEACRRFERRILLGIDARGGYLSVEGWTKTTSLRAVDFRAKGFPSSLERHHLYRYFSGWHAGGSKPSCAGRDGRGHLASSDRLGRDIVTGGCSGHNDLGRKRHYCHDHWKGALFGKDRFVRGDRFDPSRRTRCSLRGSFLVWT